MKHWLLLFSTLFLIACDGRYDNFVECVVKEEQKGASSIAVHNYCADLVKKGKLSCDGDATCKYLVR